MPSTSSERVRSPASSRNGDTSTRIPAELARRSVTLQLAGNLATQRQVASAGSSIQKPCAACAAGKPCDTCRGTASAHRQLHELAEQRGDTTNDLEQQARLVSGNAARGGVAAPIDRRYGHEPFPRVTPSLSILNQIGAGRPLDGAVRRSFESRLGADFGSVRIHT